MGMSSANLAQSLFSGSGTTATGESAQIQATGAQLGFNHPSFAVIAADVLARLGPHLAVGGEFGGPIAGAMDGTRTYAGQDLGTSLNGLFGGPMIATPFEVGPVEVRPEAVVGYQYFSVPVYSFEPHRCGKNGESTCYPSMGTGSAFVQPRISIDVHLGIADVGAYVGGNVLPESEMAAGLLAGFRF
jgi:hypothetical protein